jgi:Ca-activated chloride channel family protein
MAVLDRLSPGDVISVVTFGSEPKVLVESTRLEKDNLAGVREKIAEMAAWGTTDMAGGLQAGLQQVQSHFQARGINRIVLLGDGVPNDPSPLDSLAHQASNQGITITALGLGNDFEETRMLRLAQLSGGTFHYVEEPKQVAAVLDQEVLRLQRVVAKGSWVQLTPGPGVVLRDALGVPSSPFGRGLRVSLGDLSEGQTRDVLVRLDVSERNAGASVELFDATLHYQDPLANSQRKEQAFVGVKASADKEQIEAARDRDVEHEAIRMRVADLIVRAVQVARGGDLRGAKKMVDEATKLAKSGANDELKGKVPELKKLRSSLPSLVPPPPQQFGWGGGMRSPRPAPKPMPAAARAVRKSHGDAVRMLQGEL